MFLMPEILQIFSLQVHEVGPECIYKYTMEVKGENHE
jgi:hypothetical protein